MFCVSYELNIIQNKLSATALQLALFSPTTNHELNFTLEQATSAWIGMGGQRHAPAALPPVPIV